MNINDSRPPLTNMENLDQTPSSPQASPPSIRLPCNKELYGAQVNFGEVFVGKEKTQELSVINPNDCETVATVYVPEGNGFSVPNKEFSIPAKSEHCLLISWKPDKVGGICETILIQAEGFKCQAKLQGKALHTLSGNGFEFLENLMKQELHPSNLERSEPPAHLNMSPVTSLAELLQLAKPCTTPTSHSKGTKLNKNCRALARNVGKEEKKDDTSLHSPLTNDGMLQKLPKTKQRGPTKKKLMTKRIPKNRRGTEESHQIDSQVNSEIHGRDRFINSFEKNGNPLLHSISMDKASGNNEALHNSLQNKLQDQPTKKKQEVKKYRIPKKKTQGAICSQAVSKVPEQGQLLNIFEIKDDLYPHSSNETLTDEKSPKAAQTKQLARRTKKKPELTMARKRKHEAGVSTQKDLQLDHIVHEQDQLSNDVEKTDKTKKNESNLLSNALKRKLLGKPGKKILKK